MSMKPLRTNACVYRDKGGKRKARRQIEELFGMRAQADVD